MTHTTLTQPTAPPDPRTLPGRLGAAPPPLDTIGLRYFTINLSDAVQRQRVAARLAEQQIEFSERPEGLFLHDPAGNGVVIQ